MISTIDPKRKHVINKEHNKIFNHIQDKQTVNKQSEHETEHETE